MKNLRCMLHNVVMNPMFGMVIFTVIVYTVLQYLRVPDSGSSFDQSLFYFIAGVSLLSAIFMVMRTSWDGWTILGSGLVSHFLAVALVYFLSTWYSTHLPDSYTPELLVIARSLLIVSGIFVLVGVVKEWTERTRHSVYYWIRRIRTKGKAER